MRWRLDLAPWRIASPEPAVDLEPIRRRVKAAWDRAEVLAAEGDVPAARALLEQAHRRATGDQNLVLALALMRLRDGDAAGAARLFAGVAKHHDVREAWTGLATASLLAGDAEAALHACGRALRAHVPDAGLMAAAGAALRHAAAAPPGWCGLGEGGELHTSLPAGAARTILDGRDLPPGVRQLPPGWETAEHLHVLAGGEPLLGSPIDIQAIRRVEGFVARTATGIAGWAWHRAAPDSDPPLRVLDGAGRERAFLVATDLSVTTEGDTPCARPRGFALDTTWSGPVRVIGQDGRDLAGSPVAPLPGQHPAAAPTAKALPALRPPVDVVIPVFRGLSATMACLDSVLQTVPASTCVWVIDDGSPERALVAALQSLAAAGRIRLIGSGPPGSALLNRGFPTAANAGLRAAAGRDVVLLNSDTLVAPGWLSLLQAAAHSAADIGTATPLSNEASILSVPDPAGGNPAPDLEGVLLMAARAARANAGRLVDIPTAHGFCMFIRADCLAETGGFREDLFAQGYGEENDFCCRAAALGWRHVAVPAVYVAHLGGASFGPSRGHLLRRNQALLDRLHPGYHAAVAAHIAADPLFRARRRLDAAGWRERASQAHGGAVLLVTHEHGGGTARVVAARVASLRAEGFHPLLLLGRDGDCVLTEPDNDPPTPNLRFVLPREASAVLRLLAPWRPVAVEIHHLLGHHPSVRGLVSRLGVPVDVWVHDYAWLCPRMTLTDGEARYCGEPPPDACGRCINRWGRADQEAIAPAALRLRAARDFASARAVVVPSRDVAARLRRHMPAVTPAIRPWAAEPALAMGRPPPRDGRVRVAIIGAIGPQKGFSVVLACAIDAEKRKLNLFFTIVGYTIDDDALEGTGRVTITGPFRPDEASSLIREQGAALAFIPSTWPETWCFALTDAWEGGLRACAFDIGAQAQRVRETGLGWVVPLGLPPERVNDRLLALGQAAVAPLPPLVSGGTIL